VSASKIIVSENIEIPVIEGRVQCILCRNWKLPGEMHSNDRTCQDCYEAIKARNKTKPKPTKNNSKIIKRNAMGWIERGERPTRAVDDPELAKMIILDRAADSVTEPITEDGFRVSETNNQSNDNDLPKTITEDGFRVSETNLQRRIADLEKHCEAQAELLAKALQRIAILEEKTVPVVEKWGVKNDSDGMEKLRSDLYGILKERYEKKKVNGIYVKSLYGPNGRIGGMLGVSKATAWRLREACRLDKRFRVEKADNQKGNWTIRLNLYMN